MLHEHKLSGWGWRNACGGGTLVNYVSKQNTAVWRDCYSKIRKQTTPGTHKLPFQEPPGRPRLY